jgi:hypothetical protein
VSIYIASGRLSVEQNFDPGTERYYIRLGGEGPVAGREVVGISKTTPIRVYDLRGNVMMSLTALPNESVSVSHLPKGVYVTWAAEGG